MKNPLGRERGRIGRREGKKEGGREGKKGKREGGRREEIIGIMDIKHTVGIMAKAKC